MKKIITISREFGAGAGEIGQKVAKILGYDYVDKEIILQTARNSGVKTERIVDLDEKVPGHFGFTQSLFDMYNAPLDERLFKIQKDIIKKIGEHGKCVIVGRCANSILREFDNSLHVFLSADSYWRINRLKTLHMQDSTEAQIIKHMHEVDKARRKYCSYYTNEDFGAAESYDLCLRTSTLGIEECTKIICQLCQ